MLALVLFVVAADPSPAEHLSRGLQELNALDYDAAALDLTLAADDPAATDAEKMKAHLYAGIAHRVLGHDTEARLHFLYVMKRDPHAALPDGQPPKILAFWNLVKSELDPEKAPATPAPQPPPVSTPAPPSPPPAPGAPVGIWVAAGGGVLVVAGAVTLAIGSVPYFEHESAVDGLAAAASSGADGTVLQQKQRDARASWESWGAASATAGAIAASVGVVAAAVGGVLAVSGE